PARRAPPWRCRAGCPPTGPAGPRAPWAHRAPCVGPGCPAAPCWAPLPSVASASCCPAFLATCVPVCSVSQPMPVALLVPVHLAQHRRTLRVVRRLDLVLHPLLMHPLLMPVVRLPVNLRAQLGGGGEEAGAADTLCCHAQPRARPV